MDLDFRGGLAEATVGLAYKCKLLIATLHWGACPLVTYSVIFMVTDAKADFLTKPGQVTSLTRNTSMFHN